jgi:hypothetical protein
MPPANPTAKLASNAPPVCKNALSGGCRAAAGTGEAGKVEFDRT